MDLIDRQAALDIINHELNGWLTDDERLHLEGIGVAIESISTAPRWIPVKERLPGYGEKVLCCVDGRIYIDERELRGWRYRVTEYDAWMPLPEPWKGADDAKIF